MYIAMNEFTINESRHEEFEAVWKSRERRLKEMAGFVAFKMLKGEAKEGKRIYISHSTWNSKEEFWAWTESEQFKDAHKNRTPEGIIMGPPRFGLYEVVLEE